MVATGWVGTERMGESREKKRVVYVFFFCFDSIMSMKMDIDCFTISPGFPGFIGMTICDVTK